MNFRFTTKSLNYVYSLSFINQNFKSTASTPLTLKLKTIWLLNNLPFIFHLLYVNYSHSFNKLNIIKSLYFKPQINSFFFDNFTFVITNKLLKTKKTFKTNQLYLSFKYWATKHLLQLKTNVSTTLKQLIFKDKYYLNQYYTPLVTTNISLLNKVYRKFLFTTLLFVTYFWPNFNKTKLLTTQFLFPTTNLKLFIYYNNYFFKVFNV